ncbi:hypothetical protein AQJ67_24050 [Streptomyces caeruleatus]|uniref:Uncharacterized protein n=1 Tax=Streptomyces caeruleatus TaxID=661399 RepID=A0A101TXN7_9ACTN|nr:hypothetical protein AQJ67_24050 [Streptomyces caeruleatus]
MERVSFSSSVPSSAEADFRLMAMPEVSNQQGIAIRSVCRLVRRKGVSGSAQCVQSIEGMPAARCSAALVRAGSVGAGAAVR